jgi:hypothetical protein
MAAENPFTQMELDRWYNDACKWLRLKHQIYDYWTEEPDGEID